MGYPRRRVVDYDVSSLYHCVSRCVRRAFLCGDAWDHRRVWIENRLAVLLEIFAMTSCAYAILSNHFHLILRTDPDAARRWTALEVAERWCRLYPKLLERARKRAAPENAEQAQRQFIERLAAQKGRIRVLRRRLADVGWFHKLLKEPLARLANEQDNCTGHFWEGRFRCHRLLDDAAVLAAMVYVDLNLLRAKMVTALSECEFTSLLERLKAVRAAGDEEPEAEHEEGRKTRPPQTKPRLLSTREAVGMSTRDYVSLVARTAGVPIDGRDHDRRLSGLGIDLAKWGAVLMTTARRVGSVIGSALSRAQEAERRKVDRVMTALDVFSVST